MGEVLCSGGSVREKGNKDYDSRKMIQIFFRVSLFAIVYFGRQHYTEEKNAINKKDENCRKQLFELHKWR